MLYFIYSLVILLKCWEKLAQWLPTWGPQIILGSADTKGSAQKGRGLQKVTIFLANDYLQYWFNYFLLQPNRQYHKFRRV